MTNEDRLRRTVQKCALWRHGDSRAWEDDAIVSSHLLEAMVRLMSRAPEANINAFLAWANQDEE